MNHSNEISIEKLNFLNNQDILSFLSLEMSAILVEASIIGYPIKLFQCNSMEEIRTSSDFFLGYFYHNEASKQLVGVISYDTKIPQAEISRLFVHPQFFRRGIARSLIQRVVHDLEKLEIKEVCVTAASINLPALKLYQSLGFTYVSSSTFDGVQLTILSKIIN